MDESQITLYMKKSTYVYIIPSKLSLSFIVLYMPFYLLDKNGYLYGVSLSRLQIIKKSFFIVQKKCEQ